MSDRKTKIGEVVQAAVSAGIHVKLSLGSPEEIKTGYPVIVEGEKYDFYSIVMDVYNPGVPVIDAVATSPLGRPRYRPFPLVCRRGILETYSTARLSWSPSKSSTRRPVN